MRVTGYNWVSYACDDGTMLFPMHHLVSGGGTYKYRGKHWYSGYTSRNNRWKHWYSGYTSRNNRWKHWYSGYTSRNNSRGEASSHIVGLLLMNCGHMVESVALVGQPHTIHEYQGNQRQRNTFFNPEYLVSGARIIKKKH